MVRRETVVLHRNRNLLRDAANIDIGYEECLIARAVLFRECADVVGIICGKNNVVTAICEIYANVVAHGCVSCHAALWRAAVNNLPHSLPFTAGGTVSPP